MKVIRKDLGSKYYGMNREAAIALHVPKKYVPPERTEYIAKNLPKNLPLKEVRKHEDKEWYLMHFKHWNYKKADRFATKHEKD